MTLLAVFVRVGFYEAWCAYRHTGACEIFGVHIRIFVFFCFAFPIIVVVFTFATFFFVVFLATILGVVVIVPVVVFFVLRVELSFVIWNFVWKHAFISITAISLEKVFAHRRVPKIAMIALFAKSVGVIMAGLAVWKT